MKYKVSLYVCPGNFPFWFAAHPWFVTESNGIVSRWEVGFRKRGGENSWNHLNKNLIAPYSGIGLFPYTFRFLWKGHMVGSIEGGDGSITEKLAKFIENSPNTYQFCDQYSLVGPNSNTYVQWVLNQFPEFRVKLPWNAFGKNYK